MFPTEAWNPELRQLMERTFGAACREIDVASIREYGKAAETMMALRIMTTVAAGERDPGRLKELALQAVDGRMTDNRRASSAPCETALPSHVTRSIDPPPDSSREKSANRRVGANRAVPPRGRLEVRSLGKASKL